MAESPRFENTAAGAAFGNPNLVRQGDRAGIAQGQNATAAREDLGQAPPKAPAATQSSQLQTFSGLATALNKWQQEQVKLGKYSKADEYVIEFAPPQLGATKMKRPGSTSDDATAMQAPTGTGKDLNPATNSRNINSRTFPVAAGTIITQAIDMIMQNSDYISAQALYYIDEITGKTLPNTPNNNGQTAWYKITTHAEILGPDPSRNSNACRFTYIITPYGLSNAQSEYFNNSAFRGVHKNYDYWFTGQNTQVLQYEQEINNAYTLVLSGANANFQKAGLTSDFREKYIKSAMTRSGQSDHGAKNGANEIAANLADYLYSSGDLANIRIKIMGDPAWLFQGEASNKATKQNFTFRPFLADGTVNVDASQVLFTVSWNRPVDYDYNKGIAPVNANNKNIDNESFPQETLTYTAYRCVSSFKQGMFTQELYGSQLVDYNKPEDVAPNRDTPSNNPTASRKPTTAQKGQELFNDYAKDTLKVPTALLPVPSSKPSISDNPAVRSQVGLDINQGAQPPLTNQPPPAPATSNGDIRPGPTAPVTVANGQPADSNNTGGANYTLPQKIGTLRLNNGRVADFFESERGSYERALASGAKPVVSTPQPTVRET
jgi:hypothetical protein